MKARVDLPVDREPEVIVSDFAEPLDLRLKQLGSGSVEGHSVEGLLWVHVDLKLSDARGIDDVLEFLAEADAPVGSMLCLLDEHGQDQAPWQIALPFRYLGADDQAGPNYTGQPSVNSVHGVAEELLPAFD